ncbi:acid phosphatase-like protein [Ophiocordyceps camponoti-floridani]|uniref:Acid phosphatase-like protein n=1 Tax=Ophiocordyceps camponoti-floridani TaxID=2030778 RepID=A0A8H4VDC1_9HYPO|nr:acid phosphatase-like protein [Ophiocordyceps camponoti-floridani]
MPCFGIKKGRVIDDGNSCSAVLSRQPLHQPLPSVVPPGELYEPGRNAWPVSKCSKPGRKVRARPSSDAASRRPLISAPTNFRHLQSGPDDRSIDSQPPPPWERQSAMRQEGPYTPDSRLSPASAHFNISGITVSPPPACFSCCAIEEERRRLRQGLEPSPSFLIPRRQLNRNSPLNTPQDGTPPQIPPKAEGRSRVSSGPEVAALRERVAGAMNEVERLQRQIDEVVERQSLYANSRPSTSYSTRCILPAAQPMPSIPALPPVAPSFAERLNSDGERSPIDAWKTSSDTPASSSTRFRLCQDGGQLATVCRSTPHPPLRKKKSFTQVSDSDWLLPDARWHSDGIDRPRSGHTAAIGRQMSGSLDSASTCSSAEGDDERSAPAMRSAENDVEANKLPTFQL